MNIDINDDIFDLQTINSREAYFPDYVYAYLQKYITYLENNNIESGIIDLIKDFTQKIYICLLEYYCGQHTSAKYYFDQAINCVGIQNMYTTLDEDVFFRARKPDEIEITNDGMFHIPFEERYKVSTQRYSYPGLPCLYLGSSYQVCCDELGDWSNNLNIAYIEKIDLSKIAVLDLCFFDRYNFSKISSEDTENFLKLWSLVACCSFVYENTQDMKFRPDYIIPQLLLEYIIDKNADVNITGIGERVCGIRYHSVKSKIFGNSQNYSSINYVFPVVSNNTLGFCNVLRDKFEVKWVRALGEIQNEV